jgi:hypothetical protein
MLLSGFPKGIMTFGRRRHLNCTESRRFAYLATHGVFGCRRQTFHA